VSWPKEEKKHGKKPNRGRRKKEGGKKPTWCRKPGGSTGREEKKATEAALPFNVEGEKKKGFWFSFQKCELKRKGKEGGRGMRKGIPSSLLTGKNGEKGRRANEFFTFGPGRKEKWRGGTVRNLMKKRARRKEKKILLSPLLL